MAYIPRLVDKGICTSCYGSGWDEDKDFLKEQPIIKIKIKKDKPSVFDLDRCTVCSGSGRRIEIE